MMRISFVIPLLIALVSITYFSPCLGDKNSTVRRHATSKPKHHRSTNSTHVAAKVHPKPTTKHNITGRAEKDKHVVIKIAVLEAFLNCEPDPYTGYLKFIGAASEDPDAYVKVYIEVGYDKRKDLGKTPVIGDTKHPVWAFTPAKSTFLHETRSSALPKMIICFDIMDSDGVTSEHLATHCTNVPKNLVGKKPIIFKAPIEIEKYQPVCSLCIDNIDAVDESGKLVVGAEDVPQKLEAPEDQSWIKYSFQIFD